MLVLYIVISLLVSLTITLAYVYSTEKTLQQNMVATYVTYVFLFICVTLVWPFILLGVNFILISKLVITNLRKLVKSNNKSKQVDSQNTSKNEDSSIK